MLKQTKLIAAAAGIALALSFPAARAAEEHLDDSVQTEKDLFALEKAWNDAQLQGDADTLDKLWDDQFVVIVPKMKTISKSEALSVVKTGRVKFLRYETSDLSMRIFGDTAIVMGHLSRTRRFNDRDMTDEWHFTKFYIRRFGVWQIFLWQVSDWPTG